MYARRSPARSGLAHPIWYEMIPTWALNAIVFGGWAIADLACLLVLVFGLIRVFSKRDGALATAEELSANIPARQVALAARVSTGALLALCGLGGVIYIAMQYPKSLLALALAGGGAAQQRQLRRDRGPRNRRPTKRPPPVRRA
jgi:hypothetical protein